MGSGALINCGDGLTKAVVNITFDFSDDSPFSPMMPLSDRDLEPLSPDVRSIDSGSTMEPVTSGDLDILLFGKRMEP